MDGRKRVFFTADWHLGHENILKFSNRPFDNVEHMHRVLINNYNASVFDDSVSYFLGDVGWCDDIYDIFSRLKGIKVLLLGNHDKRKRDMLNIFDVVLQNASIVIAKEMVTLSHYPLSDLWREDTTKMRHGLDEFWYGVNRLKHLTLQNNGQFHLHGHIHSPNGGKSVKILDRQYDVGVDANGYRPVSNSEVESWIMKTKKKEEGNGEKED